MIQIHLMLLLIRWNRKQTDSTLSIQIHLMLLLIMDNRNKFWWHSKIQIHLMLLLIKETDGIMPGSRAFKYISCYY